MKYSKYIVVIAFACLMGCTQENQNKLTGEFYQLKVYSFENGDQEAATEEYLRNSFIPALKRLSINKIGVFKPRSYELDTLRKVFVLIPFESLDQFYEMENKLSDDAIYLENASQYISAPFNQSPYKRIESILLKAFDNMPQMMTPGLNGPRSDRVYELRSYESATEKLHNLKVDMFNAGGEIDLFDSLEFNAVFYGKVISGSKMPNLMYMITFENEASQKDHWSKFVNSDRWKELKDIPKYKNTVSHIDKYLLYPTEYSDY